MMTAAKSTLEFAAAVALALIAKPAAQAPSCFAFRPGTTTTIAAASARSGIAVTETTTPNSLFGRASDNSNALALSASSTNNVYDAADSAHDAADYDVAIVPPLTRDPPRRICVMVEPTPFAHVSGYSNRFKEMLRFLSKAGDDVEVLTADAHTDPSDFTKTYEGCKVHHTLGFAFPLYDEVSMSMDLPELKGWKIIGDLKPDLIHVSSPGFMVLAAMAYAKIMRIPLVMSYHTNMPVYAASYLGFLPGVERAAWELVTWGHRQADLTLATSPQMRKELSSRGVPRVDVWRKGVDTDRFHPRFKSQSMRDAMTGGNAGDFLVVYVGRLGTEKRIKDVRDVLEKMQTPATTRFAVVGEGPHRRDLEAHFEGTNTVFLGQLSGDELSRAFASADAFVMPSDSETLGFVVLESMASGVPVVGANAGGIPNSISHGETGFLVEPGDADGYASCLLRLAEDASFRREMGEKARAEAERWGWEAATSVLRNVQYGKAVSNFRAREAARRSGTVVVPTAAIGKKARQTALGRDMLTENNS